MSAKAGSDAVQNAMPLGAAREQAKALLPAAIAAYQRADYAEAASLCRKILHGEPDEFDALHLLGVLELSGPDVEEAERLLQRAVEVQPRSAEAHSSLGLACARLKRFEDARKWQEAAIALNPNFPTALTNLGNALMRLQHYEASVAAHDRAVTLRPDYADAHSNRGMSLLLLGRLVDADVSFDRALSLRPHHMAALVGKAKVSMRLRHFDVAERVLDTAFAINPRVPEALAHRGQLKIALGQFEEAEADFDAALAIDPALEFAWEGKAYCCIVTSRVLEGVHACHKALEINPESEVVLSWLGDCHVAQGDIAGALELYARALTIRPDFEDGLLKKISTMEFQEEADFAAHQAVRRDWWERIGSKVSRRELQPQNLDPEKRIKVGYVSSDFKYHSAAATFIPILRHHDHRTFEIVAYSSSPQRDGRTDECQALVDAWVDASCLSDDELADRIQQDQVDILVDLSGQTGGNRLSVFARKPAPVQVSACGSVTGTGVPTIDYLFADPVMIPEAARSLFVEQIHDLPCGITIDAPPKLAPTELPMLRNGFVTFGVFNRIEKISDHALGAWSAILEEIPESRIVIKAGLLDIAHLQNTLTGRFVTRGIAADRVRCIGKTSRVRHLSEFANIDISLDPFPQNGGVSTWESLQMGVPVVCKLGRSACSRAGGAIVTAVGLEDWVADDDDGYVAIAGKFASLPLELRALRAELPGRVGRSDAGNNAFYTRRVEEGYRAFWRRYCATGDNR